MPAEVLLVEDADVHVEFVRLAFDRAGPGARLEVARDGEAALDFLSDRMDRPPALIILDLGLPRMSGFDVLHAVRTHASEHVRRTPVVVLTTSRAPDDVQRAYDLSANAFAAKPLHLDDFVSLIDDLRAWWLGRVELP